MPSRNGQPLSMPAFKWFLLGQTVSFIAYQMLAVAVGWQIYDLTHSALSLGLVGLVQFLPQFLLTLVVGHVADHYNRRHILLIWLKVVKQAREPLGFFVKLRDDSQAPAGRDALATFDHSDIRGLVTA